MKPIPDHLRENLDVIFVGFNPSIRSSQTGHHYANPTNRFWRILFDAGITPRKYDPTEDYLLLELGYGLSNIVARPTKGADEITNEEYLEGREMLKEKIETYRPRIVCFVGKGVYQQYSGKKQIPWGKQVKPLVPGIIDFVAPSSSGLVRMKLDEVVSIYREIPALIEELNSQGTE
ncbi:mismatch-specific DNA-glycosylase [Bacillus sp. REN3]|uniref:mismatch-specific DNA-glycosylase n=1 Tax=Bacillus sp. REN3 TaxID=2802440 RepID=UPI001AEF2FFA|nr:mismatch-specific DNA-glycosylase [Bacillus sp. REN3]